MGLIRVLSPGLFTTVQDSGRPGHAGLGISACGAADKVALALGNRLVENPAAAPALEMTLLGATLQFAAATWVALAGAECAAHRGGADPRGAVPLPMWTMVPVGAGEILRCGAIRHGTRAYLCIAGGLDLPRVLGSAATHVRSGIGGLHGRALRAGDELPFTPSRAAPRPGQVATAALARLYPRSQPHVLRITDGPQCDDFPATTFATLLGAEYLVSPGSDRMGVRLAGPALLATAPGQPAAEPTALLPGMRPGELLTQGVYLGALQIPADSQPILLGVDQQTTGGYPVLASVIAADLGRIGQLRPADRVRFSRVSLTEADALLHEQARLLASADLVVP